MSTKIRGVTEQEEFIDPNHPDMEVFTLLKNQFRDKESGQSRKISNDLMWGATGLSKDLVPAWNVTMKGNTTFDSAFSENFHKYENQWF
jgi:hypothetical protein